MMVVRDAEKVKEKGVCGVPDLVISLDRIFRRVRKG